MLSRSKSVLQQCQPALCRAAASRDWWKFTPSNECSSSSTSPYYNVPAGHTNSDLSGTICNIGLGRRRDLTLRQDLHLCRDGKQTSLAEVFKGSKVFLIGFPGGTVCINNFLPGYIKAEKEMRKLGVDKVVAVTHDDPAKVQALPAQLGLTSSFVEIYSDNGGFMRLLGTDVPTADTPGAPGPRSQRFAGLVEDGILLKINVEERIGDLKVTDCKSLMALWKHFYG